MGALFLQVTRTLYMISIYGRNLHRGERLGGKERVVQSGEGMYTEVPWNVVFAGD
jgi:hypothetical protein